MIPHYFLRYWTLKNPAIWLVERILAHHLRTRIQIRGLGWKKYNIIFNLGYFQEKLITNFSKTANTIFLAHFWSQQFFSKFCSYQFLFLILTKCHCDKFFKKNMSGFQHWSQMEAWNWGNLRLKLKIDSKIENVLSNFQSFLWWCHKF